MITAKTSITGAWDTYGNAQVFGFKGGATSGTTVTCAVCPNNSYQSQVNRLAYYSGSSAVTDITASGSISFGFTGGNLSSWDVIYTIALTPQNTATAGYLKLTTASNTVPYSSDRWTKFIGISKSTVTATQTTNVQVVKEVTGLSGLTSNSIIYLSDTSGTLSTSAGSNSKKVGIATSTTSLLLKDTI